jgi:NitT/TauT family transport system permease protein
MGDAAGRPAGGEPPGVGQPAPGRLVVLGAGPGPPDRRDRWLRPAGLLAVVVAWEGVARLGLVSPLFLPPPSAVLAEGLAMVKSGELARHLLASLTRIAAGFLVGAMAGTVAGLALGTARLCEALGNPLIAAAYPIPKIALLPCGWESGRPPRWP